MIQTDGIVKFSVLGDKWTFNWIYSERFDKTYFDGDAALGAVIDGFFYQDRSTEERGNFFRRAIVNQLQRDVKECLTNIGFIKLLNGLQKESDQPWSYENLNGYYTCMEKHNIALTYEDYKKYSELLELYIMEIVQES